jgi:hypothetical protein
MAFSETNALSPTTLGITGGVVDHINGFAYFLDNRNTPWVTKINLATFTETGTLNLALTAGNPMNYGNSVIDLLNGFAYFIIPDSVGNVIRVSKVNLTTFTETAMFSTAAVGGGTPGGAVIDPVAGYIYFSDGLGNVIRCTTAGVFTVLATSITTGYAGVIDTVNGFAYFSELAGGGAPNARVVKINLGTFTEVLPAMSTTISSNIIAGAIDPINGYAYFLNEVTQTRISKVRLSDFTEVARLTTTLTFAFSASIDALNGFMYIGTSETPAKIMKIRLFDFTEVATITLTAGRNWATAIPIDLTGGYVYAGTLSGPRMIVKIDVHSIRIPVERNAVIPLIGNDVAIVADGLLANKTNIIGQVLTNQASVANGLSIEQSPDGYNWNFTTQYNIIANTVLAFNIVKVGKYFRIKYTNGAITQTAFNLYARTV